MTRNDTIVAPATPPGRGGVGIVRVSGPLAQTIASAILGQVPEPRRATLAYFLGGDGQPIDEGIALFFAEPLSFTGEDVLELQGHGGPVVMDMLVQRAVELGARPAEPGEFSQRAFLNDRLDLTQAEAIADLIDAGSREAARAALRSLQGEFAAMVRRLTEALIQLRVYVEAAIDFPEEEVDFLADETLVERLRSAVQQLDHVEASARQGRLLREGMTVVIAGRPNAGKSSLLNRLAGYDAAIVTHVPGTTRDVLRERIDIDGLPLHVLDTAGLRETTDVVEAEGVRRAQAEMERADRVLFVVDGAADPHGEAFEEERARLPADVPVTLIINKCDLPGSRPGSSRVGGAAPAATPSPSIPRLRVSARTGQGLRDLRAHLKECIGYEATAGAGTVSARRRHLEALRRARRHVYQAARQLEDRKAGELVAEELRLAQVALGEITGEFHSDELLGRIFSSFCIGK